MIVNSTVATNSSTSEYPFAHFRVFIVFFAMLLLHPSVQGHRQLELTSGIRFAATDDNSPADYSSVDRLGNYAPAHIKGCPAGVNVVRNGKTNNTGGVKIDLLRAHVVLDHRCSGRIRATQTDDVLILVQESVDPERLTQHLVQFALRDNGC